MCTLSNLIINTCEQEKQYQAFIDKVNEKSNIRWFLRAFKLMLKSNKIAKYEIEKTDYALTSERGENPRLDVKIYGIMGPNLSGWNPVDPFIYTITFIGNRLAHVRLQVCDLNIVTTRFQFRDKEYSINDLPEFKMNYEAFGIAPLSYSRITGMF